MYEAQCEQAYSETVRQDHVRHDARTSGGRSAEILPPRSVLCFTAVVVHLYVSIFSVAQNLLAT